MVSIPSNERDEVLVEAIQFVGNANRERGRGGRAVGLEERGVVPLGKSGHGSGS
jgi:hypothetical protein